MRKLFTLLFILCAAFAKGQLYDAQWIMAPYSGTGSIIDFRNNTPVNHSISSGAHMTVTSANICDSSGNLLYFTNGINIYGSSGSILTNGAGLSPCAYTTAYANTGLNIQQSGIFIPAPGVPNYYYLFHFSNDSLSNSRPGTLYYSFIWDSSGTGVVILKNVPFCYGLFRGGGMTAVKHGNGRDYWITMGNSQTNEFYEFLLTPANLYGPYIQAIGPSYPLPYDNAYSKFSQDGSKYVTGCIAGYVTVLDFDRCTGDFSNPLLIYNESSTDPIHNPLPGSVSVEFSPNGRFVYVGDRININQYDLWNSNIQDSVEIYRKDSSDLAQTDMLQLAPNGKLYSSTWAGGFNFLHVINEPDKLGDSCNFVYGGYITGTINSMLVPNMINYKLGPLIGSACDTIYTHFPTNTKEEIENTLRIIPNPANKYAYVEMGMQGDYEMQLLNENGQLLTTKQTRQVDIFDTEHLAAGVYFISVTNRQTQKQAAVKKLVVVH